MNLKNYYTKEKLLKNSSSIKKIFFFRVCGTGMGAAACLLKEIGFEVDGADEKFYPPMGDYLKSRKINLHNMDLVDNKFLQQYDLIIVGNVVPKNSANANLIENSGVPFSSFPAALGAFVLNKKTVIGIAGTHGKTTTSYFLVQILEKLNFDTGYFIGGVIDNRNSSRLGRDSYFVIEADEYDSSYFEKFSKFLSYEINHLILTSLEYDHADIFDCVEDIKDEFVKLDLLLDSSSSSLSSSSSSSLSSHKIICSDYKETKDLFRECINYGKDNSIVGPKNIICNEDGSHFELFFNNQNISFQTNIVGVHNVLNISACLLFCLKEGVDFQKLSQSILNLKMVKRRQEVRGLYKEALIIDDFAHHPTAVKSTIELIKTKYPLKKINVIMDPSSATARSSLFQDEFARSLSDANSVFLCKPIRKSNIKHYDDLDMEKIVSFLSAKNINATTSDQLNNLIDHIENIANKDQIFLILSNSTCLGLWSSFFVKKII